MKHGDRHSLRRRLLIRLWVPLLAVFLLGAVVTFVVARHIGSVVYDRWLYDSAMALAEQLKFQNGHVALGLPKPAVEMFEWDSVDRIYEEVLSSKNGWVFRNASFPLPPHHLVLGKPYFYNSVLNHQPVRIVAVMLQNPGDVQDTIIIRVAETMQKRSSLMTEIIWQSVPSQVGLLILASMFMWLAVTSSLRTLNVLAARLAGYDPEDLKPLSNFENEIPSEVRPLVHSINQLIAKLSDAQNTQRRFIANAAHQIRTPLATLQIQAERALREPDTDRQHDALTRILSAVSRLRHVAHQLLTLARSDRLANSTLQMISVDLAELARDTLESWADPAINRNIDLGYEGPESHVLIHGEPILLRELMGNLIDNAIRYGRSGGVVTLGLISSPPMLYVDDDGPGIPEDERLLVLERFYRRLDTAEEGCGLGLAISREIAIRHNAHLKIMDNPNGRGGTRVIVKFGLE